MKTPEELASEKYPEEFYHYSVRSGFVEGYNKAREELYSEKEVITVVEKITNYYEHSCVNIHGTVNIEYLADIEISLKSLKH
jgi:hypothetical protein